MATKPTTLMAWRDCASWAAFLERVTFRFPIPIEIRASANRVDVDEVALDIVMTAPDVASPDGSPIRVLFRDYPPPFHMIKDHAGYIRTQILRALAHEVDEHLMIDGTKARDPHALTDHRGLFQERFL